MHNIKSSSMNHDEITAFVLNELTGEHRENIVNAINTNDKIREMYLLEKRRYDVERYLDEEMSVGENCEFEELLIKNPSLNEHFKLSRDINEFLNVEAFRNKIDKIHYELYEMDSDHKGDERKDTLSAIEENKEENKIKGEVHPVIDIASVSNKKADVFRISKWMAAASIIIMFGFGGVKLYISNSKSIEISLFEKHYEIFQNNTKNYFISSPILKARKMYSKNESADALIILQNSPGSLDVEPEKNLYSGLVLMELKRYSEAIEKFKAIQKDDEITVLSISQWYLALCYLAIEEKNEAIPILQDIVENKSYQHVKASRILKKLI